MTELFSLPASSPPLTIRACEVDSGEPGVPCINVFVTIVRNGEAVSAHIHPADLMAKLCEAMIDAHRDSMATLYEQMETSR